jgi:hypothetical protein
MHSWLREGIPHCGAVHDASNASLPGVLVSFSGSQLIGGVRTQATDAQRQLPVRPAIQSGIVQPRQRGHDSAPDHKRPIEAPRPAVPVITQTVANEQAPGLPQDQFTKQREPRGGQSSFSVGRRALTKS